MVASYQQYDQPEWMVASYQWYDQPEWRVASYQRYECENDLCGCLFNQRLMTCVVAGLCGLWPVWLSSQSILWWPVWSMTCVVVLSINAWWLVVAGLCGLWPVWLSSQSMLWRPMGSLACVAYDLWGCWPVWPMTCDLCGQWLMWSMTYLGQQLPRLMW